MMMAEGGDYTTAHFGNWDHRYDGISPEEQGDEFSDGKTGNGNGGGRGTGGPAPKSDSKLMDPITDQAMHFITKNQADDRPFFLQLSHYAVHQDIF